jgi:hypothetical protein
MMPEAGEPQSTGPTSVDGPFLPMFEVFRDELNDHYDRRERIFKTARDITALSKKMYYASSPIPPPMVACADTFGRIFSLQR